MRKTHKCIVDEKKTDMIIKKNYIIMLITVLKTLWLKCSTTQFTLFNHALTDISLNIHYSVNCSLSDRFYDLVNASAAIITDQLKQDHQKALQAWNQQNCLSDMSILNLNNWLIKIRRLQVLSTFSRLEELKDIKNLTLSDTENLKKSWIHMQ